MVPLEKEQFSQEKVKLCENHQICRADFGKKIHGFLVHPCAKMYTCGVHEGGVPPRSRVWVEANAHAQLHPSCVLCVSMQCLQTW